MIGFKRIGWAQIKGAEMQFVGIDTRILKGSKGTSRSEIASAVEQIVAAVADEHGLVEAKDDLTLRSNLHDDLGMDEVDQMEVLFRAEERFGIVLPDNDIGPSSAVGDIVDRIAERLSEKEAGLARAEAIQAA
jgi:acyl carrier protein